MASVPYDLLFDLFAQEQLPNEVDSDDSVEIGAANNVIPITLTSTEFVQGELVFSDEIPVTMCTEWRDFKDGANRFHEWLRIELKAASSSNAFSSGHSVVATRWPRGNAWVYHTQFKPAWKGSRPS